MASGSSLLLFIVKGIWGGGTPFRLASPHILNLSEVFARSSVENFLNFGHGVEWFDNLWLPSW
jgi:hypothetical protein